MTTMDAPGAYEPADAGHGAVVEALEGAHAFRDEPVGACCPGCGTTVARYPEGLPASLVHFREACPTCELELRRWSAVVVPAEELSTITSETLARITQRYWTRHMWDGITTWEGQPRKEEFTDRYTDRAAAFGWDWELRCPVCERGRSAWSEAYLDYHHWNRAADEDCGICLCRACHTVISNGEYDADMDWEARELGFRDLHDYQVAQLGILDLHLRTWSGLPPLVTHLIDRYNLPFEAGEVRTILEQVLLSPTLWGEFEIDHPAVETSLGQSGESARDLAATEGP